MDLSAVTSQDWFKEDCIIGIDEAGRGSVVGPMVYAIAACPSRYTDDLAKRDYDDSKVLSAEKRDSMYKAIGEDGDLAFSTCSLSAQHISRSMLATNRTSLNELAAEATIALIQSLIDTGVNISAAFIDTVGDADNYSRRLSSRFPGIHFTVCPKADSLYTIVSVASIAAKVTRDRCPTLLDGQTGSGYPSDPTCQKWLQDNVDRVFGYPDNVRFSWQTVTRIFDDRCMGMKFDADEKAGAGQSSLLAFGPGGSHQRHSFFRSRQIQHAAVDVWA